MNTCLDWKSGEVVELAKQVGVESTPAFADKIGTLMDELDVSVVEQLPEGFTENVEANSDINKEVKDYYPLRIVMGANQYSTVYVKDVTIPGYEEFEFVVRKNEDGHYSITEKNTGVALPENISGDNKTIKAITANIKSTLDKQGKERLSKVISQYPTINFKTPTTEANQPQIIESNNIAINGAEVAAKYKNGVITVNRELLKSKFEVKAWTTPRKLIEVLHGNNIESYAQALPEDSFKTYEEWEEFVLEHEYQHSLLSRQEFDKLFPDKLLGDYETEINTRALSAISSRNNLQPQLPTAEQVKEYLDKNKPSESIEIKDGEVKVNPQGLSHAEVMLPAWTKKFFAKEFQDENGDVDFDKINELLPEVMDMVGYRIPTEDKYSMLPLRVVGFLPSSSGGGIMLPAEITKIAGSDYDVDKMYVMFKQLRRNSKGILEVEKFLDEKNSTLQERKEIYTNNLPEATTIKLEYKDKIKSINEEIRKVKIDKDNLKDLRAKSKDLAMEWRDLDEEISTLTKPSDAAKELYAIKGITDLNAYTEDLVEQLEDIKKEHKSINTQIDALVAVGIIETESGNASKLDVLYNQKATLYLQRDNQILNLISDEAFDKISIPEQNTKTARDNRIIDINRGILQNPSTVESIFTPGGYDYLKNVIVKTITEKLGNTNKATDIFDADHVDLMTVQNTAGRDLKGIAASHNKFRALMQHSNMKLVSPVEFDGKEFSDLSGNEVEQKSTDGRSITRNVSEPLAASVDNGKDPILALINYNSQTADLIFMLLSLGAAPMTVYSFINQAPIRDAMKRVSLGNAFSLEGALKDMYKELTDNPFSMKKTGVSAFTGKSLLESLNNTNSGHSIKVITTALHYMNSAKDLNLVTRASKADTAGAGKFTEEAITLLATIDKAKDIQTIEGVTEFLSGTDANKLVNSFTEEGVKKPVEEVLSKALPYNNELFKKIKKTIADGSTFTVTADENRDIDAAIVQLLMSDFSFYSTKEEPDVFVQGVPVIFSRLKKEFADELLKNDLFNALTIEKIGGAYTLDIIKFDNNLTASPERKEAIQKAWKELNSPYSEKAYIDHLNEIKFLGKAWDINNVTTSFTEGFKTTGETRKLFMTYMLHRFSENLLKYSFLTTGNNFTPKGLSTLIPLSLYLSKNPTNKAKDIMTEYSSVKVTKFIDQFYRHNAFNTKFVPRARTKFKDIPGNVLEVNDNRLIIDAKEPDPSFYTMETDDTTGERNKIFKPFVSFKTKEGKLNLYELVLESDTEVVYKRTYKMGIKGQIFEYNLNSNKSIIEENNLTEEELKAVEQSIKCKI